MNASRRARWLAPAIILGLLAFALLIVWLNTRGDLPPSP
jgi:hypothetical protein